MPSNMGRRPLGREAWCPKPLQCPANVIVCLLSFCVLNNAACSYKKLRTTSLSRTCFRFLWFIGKMIFYSGEEKIGHYRHLSQTRPKPFANITCVGLPSSLNEALSKLTLKLLHLTSKNLFQRTCGCLHCSCVARSLFASIFK